jgi:hypothetical protein
VKAQTLALGLALLVSAVAGCATAPTVLEARALAPDESGRCDACGVDTGADLGGRSWPDGRLMCSACLEDAIGTIVDARALLREVRAELSDLLSVDVGSVRIGLSLTDRPTLSKLAGEDLAHPDLRAFTEVIEVLHRGRVESRKFTIHALLGLPRQCLFGILAHEAFHVWQIQNGGIRLSADPAFREGAAQYAQHRLLSLRRQDSWAKLLIENPDPVYGDGLRRFRLFARDRGESKALKAAATTDRFPHGY